MYYSDTSVFVSLSSAESKRANPSQQLLSRPNMESEARIRYTTSLSNNQRISNKQSSSKQHTNWEQLVLAQLPHSSQEKGAFFDELGFGLTVQKMTTYSCRIGLVNPSAKFFTVQSELNSFEIICCSGESSQSLLGVTACYGFSTGQELSSQQPIPILDLSTHVHIFKWQIFLNFAFDYSGSYCFSH